MPLSNIRSRNKKNSCRMSWAFGIRHHLDINNEAQPSKCTENSNLAKHFIQDALTAYSTLRYLPRPLQSRDHGCLIPSQEPKMGYASTRNSCICHQELLIHDAAFTNGFYAFDNNDSDKSSPTMAKKGNYYQPLCHRCLYNNGLY